MIVLAGSQYGTGSSRDWAAKGTLLLGVKAVIATSFERIHRSNLVGMGVLPLTFTEGEDADSLGLDGTEHFDIPSSGDLEPLSQIEITARKLDGTTVTFFRHCKAGHTRRCRVLQEWRHLTHRSKKTS